MASSKKIAVAGATGRLGRNLVDVLEEQGHEVVAISRSNGVDVISGDGLADALVGVESIIDAATPPTPEGAADFFTASARNLHDAGKQAGVEQIIVVSIIGIDRFHSGYQAAKVTHEQAILAGPVPAQILRAAQFHEFVEELVNWSRDGDVSRLNEMRTQLVAARTVAEALAEMVTSPTPDSTEGPIPEIAGPREESLVEMATLLMERRGDSTRIEAVSDSDDPDNELLANGALLPGSHAKLAGPTFEEWLDAQS
jgi:uncharacterized protein YbjT (DUF2867 family)